MQNYNKYFYYAHIRRKNSIKVEILSINPPRTIGVTFDIQ